MIVAQGLVGLGHDLIVNLPNILIAAGTLVAAVASFRALQQGKANNKVATVAAVAAEVAAQKADTAVEKAAVAAETVVAAHSAIQVVTAKADTIIQQNAELQTQGEVIHHQVNGSLDTMRAQLVEAQTRTAALQAIIEHLLMERAKDKPPTP